MPASEPARCKDCVHYLIDHTEGLGPCAVRCFACWMRGDRKDAYRVRSPE